MGAKRRLSFTPRKHVKRTRFAKRTFRMRRSVRSRRFRNGPLPNGYVVAMKYTDVVPLIPLAANGTIAYQYRLNSIYDPDFTGTGHQPYGHDTMATMYTRYRVERVKYAIRARAAGVGNNTMFVGISDGLTTWNATNPNVIHERPHVQFKPIGSQTPTTISGTVDLRKHSGVTRAEYQDDRFQAVFGASPVEVILLTFGHSGNNVSSVLYDVYLKYYVKLMDPLVLAQS